MAFNPAAMIDIAEFAGAMIVIEEKRIILSFSAPAARVIGFSPDDVVGMNVSSLLPQLYRPEHERCIARCLAKDERHIIGIRRIVVGEPSDGSTSVGEAKVRAERFFTGSIRNLGEGRRRNGGWKSCNLTSCGCRGPVAIREMASSIAREITGRSPQLQTAGHKASAGAQRAGRQLQWWRTRTRRLYTLYAPKISSAPAGLHFQGRAHCGDSAHAL
ncbi:PAS domain S-box protein [Bradyrhizobium sp. STM 3566]|uniref:PAS domain S-box protein n=1 Tax=Bradyrhizobium sp. STM 3566 TaxID=578928 RepID=UPI00388E2DAE